MGKSRHSRPEERSVYRAKPSQKTTTKYNQMVEDEQDDLEEEWLAEQAAEERYANSILN